MLQPKSKTMIISIRNTKLQVAHLKKVGLSIECHIDKDRHSVSGVKKKRNKDNKIHYFTTFSSPFSVI